MIDFVFEGIFDVGGNIIGGVFGLGILFGCKKIVNMMNYNKKIINSIKMNIL